MTGYRVPLGSSGVTSIRSAAWASWKLGVRCPFCEASPGEMCVTVTGRPYYWLHRARGQGLSARERLILEEHCYPHRLP